MFINNIPELVLFQIIRSFCQNVQWRTNHPADGEKWAEKFVILAVCKKWRQIALPLVYKYSFVSVGHEFSPRESNFNDATATNLDMLPTNMLTSIYPTHLFLCVNYYDSLISLLTALVAKLHIYVDVLERVSHVTLNVYESSYHGLFDYEDSTSDIQTAAFGKDILRILPNITSIYWENLPDYHSITVFAKTLQMGYLSQLTKLNYKPRLMDSVTSLSEYLTHLCIDFSETQSTHLPHIYSKNLVSLEVTGLTDELVWSSFLDQDMRNTTNFANLKRIEINVPLSPSLTDVRPRFTYNVKAPKLEYIKFSVCTFTLSFMLCIGALDNVTLDIDIPQYAQCTLQNTKLDVILHNVFSRHLEDAVSSKESIDVALFTSDILQIPDLAEKVVLRYISYNIPFAIQNSALLSLHLLNFQNTVLITTVVGILPHLPHLVELHAKHLGFAEHYYDADVLNNDIDAHIPAINSYLDKESLPGEQPLSTSVKRMYLAITAYIYPKHLKQGVYNFFCKRIPSLDNIVIY